MSAEEVLLDVDRSLERLKASRRLQPRAVPGPSGRPTIEAPDVKADSDVEPRVALYQNPTAWLIAFISIQYLLNVFMFFPGTQSYRSVVRALPYLSSLGIFCAYLFRAAPISAPAAAGLLTSALLLIVMNLMHPTSQLAAGLAQCIFQLCIAAPLFWGYKLVRRPDQLALLLLMVFVLNLASAGLGLLQVYFPERFMPPQFSLQLEDNYLGSLSYVGSDGRMITRPPGLTDVPGGAAVAGGLTALLALGLAIRTRRLLYQLGCVAAGTIGLAAVYLAQVRSVLLMVIVGALVLSGVTIRRGRVARGSWILIVGGLVISASFWWASAVGGSVIDERFLGLRDQGALNVYQENRGGFLSQTLGEMLNKYPLGAGVGRWGMMNTSLGDVSDRLTTPIHVEIQLTGWLLDGGVLMWFLYGGAVLVALFAAWRATAIKIPDVAEMTFVVFALLVFIVGLGMSGPVFNTQLGILFWILVSALHGTIKNQQLEAE